MARSNHKSWHATSPRLEALETRNLLSIFINAKPTLAVVPSGHRVRQLHGAVLVIQPTPLVVTGVAQPPAPNFQVQVLIGAKDAEGNLVNGARPLATVVPDVSGQYTATIALPSKLRRDVNTLFAYETASGTLTSTTQTNPTTISGLAGNLQVTTPITPFNVSGPINGFVTGGGILANLTGSFSANSTTLSGTGTFTQGGTASIAATTGTQTLPVGEVAVSDPVTVLIRQSSAPNR